MAGVEQTIILPSVEAYIVEAHGSARGLSSAEINVLAEWADTIAAEIADAWPVDTSTSRDMWMAHIEQDPIAIFVYNDVDYVEWVHYAGGSADDPLWEALIPEVWDRNRALVIAAMRDAIDATEAEIRQARAEGYDERSVLSGRYRRVRAAV